MDKIAFPTDDDLSNEQKKRATRINAKRARNAERVAKISSFGVEVDIPNARVDHILASLYSLGVLGIDDLQKIQEDWEDTLREQSKPVLAQVEEAYTRALQAQEKERIRATGKTSSGLVVPPTAGV